ALIRSDTNCINALDILRSLKDGLNQHPSITREQREKYLNFISIARKEYDELAKKEVQKAFVYSYEESAKTLLDNYLDNVEAYCNWTKIRDPITGEELDPDEKLMRYIEEQIGISENAKKAFREEILIRISAYARKGKKFDYNSHERLREAIQKKLFADLKDVVKITTSTKTPDENQLKKINEVTARLIDENGYCPICANELLRYVGSLLNRGRGGPGQCAFFTAFRRNGPQERSAGRRIGTGGDRKWKARSSSCPRRIGPCTERVTRTRCATTRR